MTHIHGFELLHEQKISELNSRTLLYRHVRTGAQLLSFVNEDENKCFGITFRTPVDNSTGVAHILEHAVLCGSRKYPLKDPFIELAKGSLNTFLNAFTYPDKTCYPIASQNLQDFYNLIDVYVDTVFHPRLTLQTFQEQGWHYEIEKPEDPLIYKGVVFNEMKGAYSSPERMLYKQAQMSLFPDTIYSADSGGDPRHIPDLTYEQLKAFHHAYYHPSNSLIVMYGDDDPEERLRLLDGYLSEFEMQHVEAVVPLQPRFTAPRRIEATYAVGQEEASEGDNSEEKKEDDNKAMVSVNWLLTEATEAMVTLGLAILEQILIGTPAAPLRKALIDSRLGADLTGSGLDSDLRQMIFLVGMKGIRAEDADKVESLILTTLTDLAREGIDPDTLEAALNTVEFALRENNTGSFPRGLSLMLRSLTVWLYGGDPIAPLAYEAPLNEIKTRAREGKFFEELIKVHLLDNPHRTTVLLTPDATLDTREAAAERARLSAVKEGMDQTALTAAVNDTLRLKQLQGLPDSPEDQATLPLLKRDDLDKHVRTIPIQILPFQKNSDSGKNVNSGEDLTILYHDLFTNGIVYMDLGMDLHALPTGLLPYMSLFGRSLLEIGTETEDFVKLMQRIGQKTGGIRQQSLLTTRSDTRQSVCKLFLRGKSTPAQAHDLLAIMRDLLLTVRLDNQERFRQMAQEEKARLEARIAPSGSAFISRRLRSRYSEADWVGEQMGGISYLFFLRELLPAIDADWAGVLSKLEQIRSLLVNRQSMACNVTLDQANWSRFKPELNAFLAELPLVAGSSVAPGWERSVEMRREGLTIPGQVNYVGKAANLYDLGFQLSGAVQVVLNYLNTSWLWEKVRKEGGAYGVNCGLDRLSGVIGFTSYRDPNLIKTLQNFDGSSRFLRELNLNQSELTRAIIGVIGDLDAYQLPDAKGFTSMVRHLTGYTDALRQQNRDEVLGTTLADFHAFADILDQVNANGLIGVVGAQSAIETANREQPGLLDLVKVL